MRERGFETGRSPPSAVAAAAVALTLLYAGSGDAAEIMAHRALYS